MCQSERKFQPHMADDPTKELQSSWGERARDAALWIFFALMLLIPKTLALRRRRWLWNTLRVGLALVGAMLLAAGGRDPTARLSPVLGLLLILLALLPRPPPQGTTVDERARELGALVVVNGGRLLNGETNPEVRLFVGPERLHALDPRQQPCLEIPLNAVTSLAVEQAENGWRLLIEWSQGSAEFHYQGHFAEHLARVADTTLRSQVRRELPVVR